MNAMRIFAAIALLFGLAGAATGQPAPPALEDRVLEVARELRCPVCQNLSVADSPSELAQEMRGVIREQLRAGRTPEEIKAYFLAKYGDWILLSPRPGGIGWLVWVGPFAGAAAGLLVAGLAIWRWSRRRQAAPAGADPALVERACREALEDGPLPGAAPRSPLEAERLRLYAALRELDFDRHAGKLSAEDYAEMRQDYGARAAVVLAALRNAPPDIAQASVPRRRSRRLAAGMIFLLAFGVALVVFLSGSLRPRGEGDSTTGDFLTGTGPGGVSPSTGAMPGPIVAQIREYRARLAKDPRDVEALLGIGELNVQRQNPKEAIEYYKRVLEIEPENPRALAPIGLILGGAGYADEALRIFERILARDPNYPVALWGKGWTLYERKQDYAGAIAAWERLLGTPGLAADTDQIAALLVEARKKLAASR
jgi:cytochrome c-type biogenesis protein CcmH